MRPALTKTSTTCLGESSEDKMLPRQTDYSPALPHRSMGVSSMNGRDATVPMSLIVLLSLGSAACSVLATVAMKRWDAIGICWAVVLDRRGTNRGRASGDRSATALAPQPRVHHDPWIRGVACLPLRVALVS